MLYTVNNRYGELNWQAQGVNRVAQNIRNLLCLWMAEVPYDRLRGMDTGVEDTPVTQIAVRVAMHVDRVLQWEPRARLLDTRFRLEDGHLIVEVDVEIAEGLG